MKFYTLAEAAQISLNREHRLHGHEWEEWRNWDGGMTAMMCRCGARAQVTEPTLPEGREVQESRTE